jgi:AbrB family looped-hinge helix DNA binding protein
MHTTLSSKGQIVIPSQIRQSHGWKPGAIFTIIDEGNALLIKPVGNRKTVAIEDVIGCAGYKGAKKSLSEMDAGILEEARKQAKSWLR